MKIIAPTIILAFCTGGLIACGGINDAQLADNNTPSSTTAPDLLTGRFVDSAVAGLQYTTQTQASVTNSAGEFRYQDGETVTFSIGDISLPQVDTNTIITPLSVFNTENIADRRVVNLARLLQSLDVDANPANGISISETALAGATALSVDFSATEFDTQVTNLVANSGSITTSLIDTETALDHFQQILFDEGIVQRPSATDSGDSNANNTSNHRLVGDSADFTSLAHQVAGTLTVIDDQTLEISNFNYDGGGPSVYFYLGSGGSYESVNGGRQVGTLLSGRMYQGESIRIAIPADLTLDDFDGVSVWCDLFAANFGDARFTPR